jgi:hypothetical protein
MAKTTKKTKSAKVSQSEINAGILSSLENIASRLDKIEESGKSGKVAESTQKVESKADEWITLAESGKGKRTTLAPQDKTGKYQTRGIVVSRFAKSIFVPADQFAEFVAEVEVAYQKGKELGVIPQP